MIANLLRHIREKTEIFRGKLWRESAALDKKPAARYSISIVFR